VSTFPLVTDPASGLTLSARRIESDGEPMWFVGLETEDRWLTYTTSQGRDDEAMVAMIASELQPERMLRLVLFLGEVWEPIQLAPKTIAKVQEALGAALSVERYEKLLALDLDGVREERSNEEEIVIADLLRRPTRLLELARDW
jgi:hypothetical protein